MSNPHPNPNPNPDPNPNPSPNSNPHPKQELSKTNASVLMIEAADDVTQGTTNGLTTLPPY